MTPLPPHSPSCAWIETRRQPVRFICNCVARFQLADRTTQPDGVAVSSEPEVWDAEAALSLSLLAMARLVTTR